MRIGQKIPNKPKAYTQEELKTRTELEKLKDCYIFDINSNQIEPIKIVHSRAILRLR